MGVFLETAGKDPFGFKFMITRAYLCKIIYLIINLFYLFIKFLKILLAPSLLKKVISNA